MSKQQRTDRRRARREAEARAEAARKQRTRLGLAALVAVAAFGAGGFLLGTAGDDDTADAAAASTTTGTEQTQEPALLSAAEADQLLADPPADLQVLDVRTPEEVAEGTIVADPVNIDFYRDDFSAQLAELDRDKPYLVYCRSGNRSGQAVQVMADLGFTQVYDLAGGISGWTAQGFQIVR